MRTVNALFDTQAQASRAVRDLEAAGFSSSEISIVSQRSDGVSYDNDDSAAGEGAATGAGVGAAVGGAGGLLAGLGMLAIPGVGPVVAAGWLAATLAGAVGGAVVGGAAGGLVGALTDAGVSEDDANAYAEGVRRGGALVTARVEDGRAAEAEAILGRADSVDIAARRDTYRGEGWTKFDNAADPYVLPTRSGAWDRVEGNWMQAKGKVKEQWGKLTDDDLDVINGKRDQLEGKLQERYGLAKDQAQREIDDWCSSTRW